MKKEEVLKILKENPMEFTNLSDVLRDDKNIVLKAITFIKEKKDFDFDNYDIFFKSISERLRDDREVMKESYNIYPWALEFAGEKVKNDKEFFIEINKETYLFNSNFNDGIFFMSENLKNDKEFIKELEKIYEDLAPKREENKKLDLKNQEEEWSKYIENFSNREFSNNNPEFLRLTLNELQELGDSVLFHNKSLPTIKIGDYIVRVKYKEISTEEDGIVDYLSKLEAINTKTKESFLINENGVSKLLKHLEEKNNSKINDKSILEIINPFKNKLNKKNKGLER